MEVERQFFHLSPKVVSENEYDLNEEKFMLQQIFGLFDENKVLRSFDENESVRDANNVALVAEIIKVCQKYNFKVNKIQSVFTDIKSFFSSIENLTRNNINELENEILVKALKIEEKGKTNSECLRNITFSDYEKILS